MQILALLSIPFALSTYTSLVLIKPDAVAAGHTDTIIRQLKEKQFEVVNQARLQASKDLIRKHYEEHLERSFYPGLEEFMLSGDIVALTVESADADVYERLREFVGATDSRKASEGTLRKQFGTDNQKNAIHASEDYTAACRELSLWFPEQKKDEL